jgi:DNA-binding NarL/FixJ family response regulator
MALGPISLVIAHPAAAFRRGLGSVLDPARFSVEQPESLDAWLEQEGSRALVVAETASGWEELLARGVEHPDVLVVVLVAEMEPGAYRHALAAGAAGVAHVDAAPELIAHVVSAAVDGEVVMPAEIARRVAGRAGAAPRLGQEELAMLQDLSEGATVVELAERYFLAERSVRRKLQNVYMKLGATSRAEAMKRAAQLGLLD